VAGSRGAREFHRCGGRFASLLNAPDDARRRHQLPVTAGRAGGRKNTRAILRYLTLCGGSGQPNGNDPRVKMRLREQFKQTFLEISQFPAVNVENEPG